MFKTLECLLHSFNIPNQSHRKLLIKFHGFILCKDVSKNDFQSSSLINDVSFQGYFTWEITSSKCDTLGYLMKGRVHFWALVKSEKMKIQIKHIFSPNIIY